MRIEVTAEDIAKGKPDDCRACPIAVALQRIGYPGFAVDGDVISVWSESSSFITRPKVCDIPDEARVFINDFDEGHSIEPFSFELDIPAGPPGEGRATK